MNIINDKLNPQIGAIDWQVRRFPAQKSKVTCLNSTKFIQIVIEKVWTKAVYGICGMFDKPSNSRVSTSIPLELQKNKSLFSVKLLRVELKAVSLKFLLSHEVQLCKIKLKR